MPTAKQRVSVTLPKHMALYIRKMSLRDDVSQSMKIVDLLDQALELEEDEYWSAKADAIDRKTTKWISHEQFWKKLV